MATNEAVAESAAPPPLEQQRAGERNLAPAPPPGPKPVDSPEGAAPTLEQQVAGSQFRMDALAKQFETDMAAANAKYTAAEDEAKAFQARRAEEMRPIREKLLGQLGQPTPKAPEAPAEPPLPQTGARPFLEGLPGESTTATLQKALMGLSLIAQMGVGIGKGYANGALAAYTGALQGWQQGDKQRAENEWHQYLQQVASMQRDYKRRRQAYDDIIEANKWDLQKTQLELGMKAAEMGEEKEAVDLAFKNHDAFLNKAKLSATMLEKLQNDSARLTSQLLMKRETEAANLRLEQYRQEERNARNQDNIRSREMIAELGRQAALDRNRGKVVEAPPGGQIYDRQTKQFVNSVPGEDYHAEPGRYGKYKADQIKLITQFTHAEQIMNRLAEIAPDILAKQGGENLINAIKLRAEGKLASNAELREFTNLVEEGNIELTNALQAGGQLRTTLLEILRKHVGASEKDTIATGMRAINTIRTTLDNRMRGYLDPNAPLPGYRTVPKPGKWTAVNTKTGKVHNVEFEEGERLKPEWELGSYKGPVK